MTTDLVRFETVSAEQPPTGPAFAAMQEYLQNWATKNSLGFHVFGENDAWEVTLGEGPRKVGFVMHADVVPVDPTRWTHPAFDAKVIDGLLYGRGVEDDKGPIAAVLVVMRTLKRFGTKLDGQIVAILGTGEEHDWDGMVRYAKAQLKPEHVISVDASFPVVIAESGFVAWRLKATPPKGKPNGHARIVRAEAGKFLTQVPDNALMALTPARGESLDALLLRANAAIDAETSARGAPFRGEAKKAGETVEVTTYGEAVHSSTADDGHNAMWMLAGVAARLDPEPSAVSSLLRVVSTKLDGDHWGEKLGIAHDHDVMGKLLVTPTMLKIEGDTAELSVNMRRPAGPDKAAFRKLLDDALARIQNDVDPTIEKTDRDYIGDPAMANTDSDLVPTLMRVYRERMNDPKAEPLSIRGGTYARLFPGAVSFGPSLPGKPYRGHAPNESIELATLDATLQMLFEAALRLGAAPATASGTP